MVLLVLGPLLFAIYFYDIFSLCENAEIILHAVDIVIVCAVESLPNVALLVNCNLCRMEKWQCCNEPYH